MVNRHYPECVRPVNRDTVPASNEWRIAVYYENGTVAYYMTDRLYAVNLADFYDIETKVSRFKISS